MALCQIAAGQYNLEPTLHFKNQGMVCCIIAALCRLGNLPLTELADLAKVKDMLHHQSNSMFIQSHPYEQNQQIK
jgi:hypothetical protein